MSRSGTTITTTTTSRCSSTGSTSAPPRSRPFSRTTTGLVCCRCVQAQRARSKALIRAADYAARPRLSMPACARKASTNLNGRRCRSTPPGQDDGKVRRSPALPWLPAAEEAGDITDVIDSALAWSRRPRRDPFGRHDQHMATGLDAVAEDDETPPHATVRRVTTTPTKKAPHDHHAPTPTLTRLGGGACRSARNRYVPTNIVKGVSLVGAVGRPHRRLLPRRRTRRRRQDHRRRGGRPRILAPTPSTSTCSAPARPATRWTPSGPP